MNDAAFGGHMESIAPLAEIQTPSFDAAPTLGHVETDAFCEGCGYSLRGQPIRREPTTKLVVTRCPECGRFAPSADLATAGRMWLNRLATFALVAWVLLAVAATIVEMLIVFGICMGTADEATSVLRYGYNYYSYEPFEAILFFGFMGAMVTGFAFVGAMVATAAFPHWYKWAYYAFALTKTAVLLLAVGIVWTLAEPQYLTLLPLILLPIAALHGVAGALGALLGRPIFRLLARVVLPQRLRVALGYLWTVDGFEPPHPKPSPR